MKRTIQILALSYAFAVSGQTQLGLRTSNYSGVNSVLLNPSSFHNSPLKWDVNLLSAGVFAYNQYAYVENASVLDVIKYRGSLISSQSLGEGESREQNSLYYNFFNHNRPFTSSINAFVTGPSVQFRWKDFTFGVFTNSRLAFSSTKLDSDLDYFSLDQWAIGESKEINPFVIAGMAWGEVGVNMATTLRKNLHSEITAGVNLKYLMGMEGFYIQNRHRTTITSLDDTTLINGGPIEYGFTPAFAGSAPTKNGNGASADIGFNIIKRAHNGKPYHWKLGLSVVDLGFIHFNKGSQKHSFDQSDVYDLDNASISGNGLGELSQNLSEEAFGDASQSLVANDFTILTPSALSLQFDYSITKKWFANATVNRRFNLHQVVVDRENLWSVSARYETKWFEFGVPVVLYDDKHLRVGTFVRLWMLTVGSDHINSIFLKQRYLAGSDIYFALRINSLSNPFTKRARGRKGLRNTEDCYF